MCHFLLYFPNIYHKKGLYKILIQNLSFIIFFLFVLHRFPSGYGLFMFLQGNITFAIGPLIGYIRDVTESYPVSFHCLTFVMALCVVPWLIEIIYFRLRKSKNNQQSSWDKTNLHLRYSNDKLINYSLKSLKTLKRLKCF